MGKWFPKVYDTLMAPLEKRKFRLIRQRLIGKASGKVLEVGSGTGINFPFYNGADKVIATEPDSIMRERSLKRLKDASVPIDVIVGDAQALSYPDNSFDTVVGTLVLCTIPDPEKALNEMRRVCKPDGQILFFEHVLVKQPFFARLQDWSTPLWKKVCDGCHLNRDTLSTIKKVGFTVDNVDVHSRGLFLVIEAMNTRRG